MKKINNYMQCGCGKRWGSSDKDAGFVTCDECKAAERARNQGKHWDANGAIKISRSIPL